MADVVRYNPNVDHVVTVDKKGKDNSVGALWRIGRELHKNHYDILINLHPNERTSFLAAAIQAKQFVGMSHFLIRPFMDTYTRLDRLHFHAADMYLNVLVQLGIDDYRGGQLAAECFLSHGHTCLAFAGPISTGVISERLQGFSDTLQSAGHPLSLEQTHAFPDRSAEEILRTILKSDPRPTGLFVTSDDFAAEFYSAAAKCRISIPKDLSLIGFDDFPISKTLVPPLTTIRQDIDEKARQTCRILLDRLKNPGSPTEDLCLDVALTERKSVKECNP